MENKSKPESNENNYYNYVALFFWLYENTKINNKSLLKPTNLLLQIGKCLNLIYGNELKRVKLFNKELKKQELFYNLELLPESKKKHILINGKQWSD